MRLDVVGVVFAGGCVGGWVRHAAVSSWPAGSGAFPWSTLAVNLAGAFLLAVVIVVVGAVRPSRYLRPLLGTGFCGALTTFSSVVVASVQLISGGHADVAAGYLAATVFGGLAAAASGLVLTRRVVGTRHRGRQQGRE